MSNVTNRVMNEKIENEIEKGKNEFDNLLFKCYNETRNKFIMKSLITSLNNYLVLWQYEDEVDFLGKYFNELYYVDMFNNKVLIEQTLNDNIIDAFNISDTNDVIIRYKQGLVNLVHFNELTNTLAQITIIEDSDGIKVENGYLIVLTYKNFLLFKVDELRSYNKDKVLDSFTINERIDRSTALIVMEKCCISSGQEYFVVFTQDHKLCIYKFKENTNEPIAFMFFDYAIKSLISSSKYISLVYHPTAFGHGQLVSFELND